MAYNFVIKEILEQPT